MSNNLFVSYDLHAPGQNYEAVATAIRALGEWTKVHYSLWYVNSTLSSEQAVDRVWKVMDANDCLMVIDATHNSAHWQNLSVEAGKFIQDHWYR